MSFSPLPADMVIRQDGEYFFQTEPGSRWVLGLSGDFEDGSVAVHYVNGAGDPIQLRSAVNANAVHDFRAPGRWIRLYVVGISVEAAIVLDLSNVPGQSTDDLVLDLANEVSGVLPVANGGWGSSNGSFTSATIALSTSANGNITFAPNGTGKVSSSKKFEITDTTASTTVSTGALTVAGGVGILGDLRINSHFYLPAVGNINFSGRSIAYAPAANCMAVCGPFGESGVFSTTSSFTVATLPAAASYPTGRAFVSNSNATTFGAVVAGGGSNIVPVYSDGTNWRIG